MNFCKNVFSDTLSLFSSYILIINFSGFFLPPKVYSFLNLKSFFPTKGICDPLGIIISIFPPPIEIPTFLDVTFLISKSVK